jgi:hypothetical protein
MHGDGPGSWGVLIVDGLCDIVVEVGHIILLHGCFEQVVIERPLILVPVQLQSLFRLVEDDEGP